MPATKTKTDSKEFRTVKKRFFAGGELWAAGDEIDCSELSNKKQLISAGYLSLEYRVE